MHFKPMSEMMSRLSDAVAHRYRVEREIGAGGMATVYLADDLKLHRKVAIKVLRPELAAILGAERFLKEVDVTANLGHPHILPLFDSGEADGLLYYVMPFIEGESVRARLERQGRLPVSDAVRLLRDVADALAHAHSRGLVHRDIKPDNVLMSDRHALVTDFGVAKAISEAGSADQLTTAGVSLGTPAYMAPEQIGADPGVDHRADIYALGVLGYEVLVGEPPFTGDSSQAVLSAHMVDKPRPIATRRSDLPPALGTLVMRCLEKNPADRFQRADEILASLEKLGTGTPTVRSHMSRGRVIASLAIVLGLVVAIGVMVNRSLDRAWARADAVMEMRQLADAADFATALEVGERALAVLPNLPEVDSLLNEISGIPTLETDPPGATVFMRGYNDTDGPWVEVGTTPLSGVRVPCCFKRWRFELEGFERFETIGFAGINANVTLPAEGSAPQGMVSIPGGEPRGGFITGMGPLIAMGYGDYFIDRFEVTNAEYQEFVEAGGYESEEFWKYPFVEAGRQLTWSEAMGRMEDATGRSGPATWELGRPKSGEESLPVTGVSWYEAAAYAEFKGMMLPTLRHWVWAASTSLGGAIIPLSNFAENGPAAPGVFQGMSQSGAFDMAGNVREWVLNSAGDQRHAVGGAWSDPSYFFSGPNVQPPFDRLPVNGFRLAKYDRASDSAARLATDMPLSTRHYDQEQPVSDEVYRVFAAQFNYDPSPLDAEVEETLEYEYGTIERVSYAGVGWGRIHAFLYTPSEAAPPYQTVVFFPGSNVARLQPDPDPRNVGLIQHFVASGRAVLLPIFRATYSRAEADQPPNMNTTWPKQTREYVDLVRSWGSEVRRSIDYLETRPEIDSERIAYYGYSWGGRLAAIIPAVEARFKVNIAMLGGLASGTALPEVDQINYVTRITVPTLMLNGRDDPLEPVESAQIPMWRMLGTPEKDKRHVIYDGFGHALPRTERIRETLDWLDKYFGVPD